MPRIAKNVMYDAIKEERRHLGDLLAELTPDDMAKPSLCEGWSVARTAGHAVGAGDAPWGFLWTMITRQNVLEWMEKKSDEAVTRGREDMAGHVRSRPIPIFARFGAMGRHVVFGEMLLHQEDIRRPVGKPRTDAPNPGATWAFVNKLGSQFNRCKSAGKVRLQVPSGLYSVWNVQPGEKTRQLPNSAQPDVTVFGEPLELAMFVTGRLKDAKVDIQGSGSLADELRKTPLRYAPFG